jgi:hypothetical protein
LGRAENPTHGQRTGMNGAHGRLCAGKVGKLSALACGARPTKSRFSSGMTNEKERATVWVGVGQKRAYPRG